MTEWRPEHDNALREYLAAGMSHREAAAEINTRFNTKFSRNAAIGRASRKGIPTTSHATAARPTPKRPDTRRAAIENAIRKIEQPRVAAVNPQNVTLLELALDGCRWPSGDHPGITFCNHPRTAGSSYCAPHYRLSLGREYTIADRDKYNADRRRRFATAVSVLAQD